MTRCVMLWATCVALVEKLSWFDGNEPHIPARAGFNRFPQSKVWFSFGQMPFFCDFLARHRLVIGDYLRFKKEVVIGCCGTVVSENYMWRQRLINDSFALIGQCKPFGLGCIGGGGGGGGLIVITIVVQIICLVRIGSILQCNRPGRTARTVGVCWRWPLAHGY